jgi:hypothetical protein
VVKDPRQGLGRSSKTHFFSEPIVSLREVYWPLRVLMNHLRTRRARSSGVAPAAITAKSSGRSHQYATDRAWMESEDRFSKRTLDGAPGNSVKDTGERMNGGAVSEERSPEKAAML